MDSVSSTLETLTDPFRFTCTRGAAIPDGSEAISERESYAIRDDKATLMTTMTTISYEEYWDQGSTWLDYLETEVEKHPELWAGVYRKSRSPEWAADRFAALGMPLKLLVITEDWCGDASNTVPVFARLAETVPSIDLRVVKRDESLDLMDLYLTNDARSIPIVIVLDEDFQPLAHWGPRPAELQEFVIGEKRAGLRPSSEIYKDTRRWYARDRGETSVRELLEKTEAALEER